MFIVIHFGISGVESMLTNTVRTTCSMNARWANSSTFLLQVHVSNDMVNFLMPLKFKQRMTCIICLAHETVEPQAKRKGFRIRKKSSSQSESGSPPSPKFFNSLEQLSMSTESTDMPTSTSSSAIHVYGSSGNISIGISSSNSGVVAGGPQIKSPQHAATATSAATAEPEHQHQESISRGTKKGLHSPFHGTPKGTRRFSILSSSTNTGRSCSSVPSSPKLSGLSSISIPLLSPCRTFFGHLTTNNSSSNERHAQKSNKNTSSTAPSSISAAGSRHSGGTTLTVITNTTTTGGGGAKSFTPVFGSSSTSSSPKEIPSQKQKSPHVSNDTWNVIKMPRIESSPFCTY